MLGKQISDPEAFEGGKPYLDQQTYGRKLFRHDDWILGSQRTPNVHTNGGFVLGLLMDAEACLYSYVLKSRLG